MRRYLKGSSTFVVHWCFVGDGVKGFLHPKGSSITLQNCCYCGTLGRSMARHYLLVCHKMQWSCLLCRGWSEGFPASEGIKYNFAELLLLWHFGQVHGSSLSPSLS